MTESPITYNLNTIHGTSDKVLLDCSMTVLTMVLYFIGSASGISPWSYISPQGHHYELETIDYTMMIPCSS